MLIVCPHCRSTNRVPAERAAQDPVCGRCGKALLDGQPLELTDSNFDAIVGKTELPIVVDFWASWCGPCQMMAPHFKRASERLKGRAILAKIDSDKNPSLSARFAIRSLPTLLMLQAGREVKRQAGAAQEAAIVAWAESAK